MARTKQTSRMSTNIRKNAVPTSGRQTRSTAQCSGTSARSKPADRADAQAQSDTDTEEDLPSKVKRLEGMVVRLQNKIEEILDSLLCHRSERLAARDQLNQILDREEEVRLSVVAQLRSCLNPVGSNRSGNEAQHNQNLRSQQDRVLQKYTDNSHSINDIEIEATEYSQYSGTEDQEFDDGSDGHGHNEIVIKPELDNDDDNDLHRLHEDEDESEEWVPEGQLDMDMEVDDDHDDPLWEENCPSAKKTKKTKAQKGPKTFTVATTSSTATSTAPQKKKTCKFTRINSFPTQAEAVAHVLEEGTWTEGKTITTLGGTKIHYNCKDCSWCPVKSYLFYERPGAEVHQFVAQADHDHTAPPESDHAKRATGDRPASELEFIPSTQGKELAVLDGFTFVNHKTSQKGTRYFMCSQHPNLQCRARLVLHIDGTFVRNEHDHTGHLPNPEKIEAYKLRASIKQMATCSNAFEPAEVMSHVESMLLLNNDRGINVASMIGSKDSLRRTIQRLRQKAAAPDGGTKDTGSASARNKRKPPHMHTNDMSQDADKEETAPRSGSLVGAQGQGPPTPTGP